MLFLLEIKSPLVRTQASVLTNETFSSDTLLRIACWYEGGGSKNSATISLYDGGPTESPPISAGKRSESGSEFESRRLSTVTVWINSSLLSIVDDVTLWNRCLGCGLILPSRLKSKRIQRCIDFLNDCHWYILKRVMYISYKVLANHLRRLSLC